MKFNAKSKILKGLIAASLVSVLVLGLGWRYTELSVYQLITSTIKGNKTTDTITVSNQMKVDKAMKVKPVEATWVAGTGFTINPAGSYSAVIIDVADATTSSADQGDTGSVFGAGLTGASVVITAPTSTTDNTVMDVIYESSDSGTTAAVMFVNGLLPLFTASGVTDGSLNADGETWRIMWNHNGTSGVSVIKLGGSAS